MAVTDHAREWFDYSAGIYGLKEMFHRIFTSFDMKMVKRGGEMFERVLGELNVKPQEAVFIDDHERNVEAAKRLGIKSFVYRDMETLRKDMESVGVKL